MATTPPSPQPEQKKSSVLAWVLGLLAAGIVALTLLGLAVAYIFMPRIQVQQSGDQVAISTPVGNLKVGTDAAAEIGLPVFPNATVADLAATVEITAPDGDAVSITAAKYRTNQALSVVDDWYRERLGPEYRREGSGVMVEKRKVFGMDVRSDDTAYIHEKDDELHVVGLRKSGLGVEIALVRIGPRAAQ